MGGYTRNMSVYLAKLGGESLNLKPFYHSVRGQYYGIRNWPPLRMLRDTTAFLFTCLTKRPDAVHVLAQYRGAILRELGQALICRALQIPFGYDVKAGAFASSLETGNWWYRAAVKYVIDTADILFAEGRATQDLLTTVFKREAVYFPNFVPMDEVPSDLPVRLAADTIRVLFVGFCHRDKGVFDLVEGARIAARSGVSLEIDLIGAETAEFTSWIDGLPAEEGFTIRRHGKQPHENVLEAMGTADLYGYLTRHPGEGHNNSINEAMMNGLVILTSRQGFLNDILAGDCALFMDCIDPHTTAAKLCEIADDRTTAREIGQSARRKLLAEYTETTARQRFASAYISILGPVEVSKSMVKQKAKDT